METFLPRGCGILEIGCGTGGNLKYFADFYRVVGCDISADAVRLARRRCPGIEVRHVRSLAEMKPSADSFRGFLLLDVLEHVEDDRALAEAVVELMPRGARLFVTVPADMRLWSEHDISFGHFRRYDRRGFCALWDGLPIALNFVSHCNRNLYPVIRLVRAISRARGGARGLAGTDFTLLPPPVNRALFRVFAGESRRLTAALAGRESPYRYGASLVAVLEKTSG